MKLTRIDQTIDIEHAMEIINTIDGESVYTANKEDKLGCVTILLDSCIRVSDTGDHTLLFFHPELILSGDDKQTVVTDRNGTTKLDQSVVEFIDTYQGRIGRTEAQHRELIFNGGFAGYLSYDYGMKQLNIPRHNHAYSEIPDACFGYFEEFLLIDWRNKCTYLHTNNQELVSKIEEGCKQSMQQSLMQEEQKVKASLNMAAEHNESAIAAPATKLVSNFTREQFKQQVQRVRQYIKRGDVYQVNISQQFSGKTSLNPLKLYKSFRRANYGPYNAFLSFGAFSILSTSPEQFIRVREGKIMSRPIKGTIRKSLDSEENELLKQELLSSEKNRAELLMIIDLERNDLSKICVPGSVRVDSLYAVEEYATVNHLVSTITGTLQEAASFAKIIKAMFPGGSITGAPKIRAMEIIEELEPTSRGIYTGSIGYISNNGNMDFNIAIRTAVVNEDRVFYNVGGGITWDSEPEDEFEETIHKGSAIYNVLVGRNQGWTS